MREVWGGEGEGGKASTPIPHRTDVPYINARAAQREGFDDVPSSRSDLVSTQPAYNDFRRKWGTVLQEYG